MSSEQKTGDRSPIDDIDIPQEDSHRADRRRMIKKAVSAVPVVLTISAGTAHAGWKHHPKASTPGSY